MFEHVEGATPIDDVSGLIPVHIRTKKELDEWEAENILDAVRKYLKAGRKTEIDTGFFNGLHKDMFGNTWKWAGTHRKKGLNIGVGPEHIAVELRKLLDDMKYWKEKGIFDVLERSIRMHHRLVWIHPYLNGNGRHARLAADILLFNEGHALPAWPEKELVDNTDVRKRYIAGLKAGDKGDFSVLLKLIQGLIG